jgi:hypothetical protein
VTLLIPDAGAAKNFSLGLYRPNGLLLASSDGPDRQETIGQDVSLVGTGLYRIRVGSDIGSGAYWLDVSAGATSLVLGSDG